MFASNPPWLALMWLQFMSHGLYTAQSVRTRWKG